MAVGKGLIDIEAPVSRYLGKGWSKAGAAEQAILVRHLLSMDSGLDTQLRYEQPAGTHWRYNTSAYSQLISILEGVTHQEIGPLTKEWVFDPIGMRDSRWGVRTGIWSISNVNAARFQTTPRDLARLGLLVMMDGKWGGKDIVCNDNWFPLSVSASQELNPAYGYLWWLNGADKHRIRIGPEPPLRDGPLVTTAPRDLIIAMGHEKRRLYISPSNKLVIVRFGSDPGRGFDREFWTRASAAFSRLPVSSRSSPPPIRPQGLKNQRARENPDSRSLSIQGGLLPIRPTRQSVWPQRDEAALARYFNGRLASLPSPCTPPSIIGQTTAIALPMIVVEEKPTEPHGSAKARVRITDGTKVLRRGEGVVSAAELRVGQQVKVWFTGPVMESYPLQATAGVIIIEPSAR